MLTYCDIGKGKNLMWSEVKYGRMAKEKHKRGRSGEGKEQKINNSKQS